MIKFCYQIWQWDVFLANQNIGIDKFFFFRIIAIERLLLKNQTFQNSLYRKPMKSSDKSLKGVVQNKTSSTQKSKKVILKQISNEQANVDTSIDEKRLAETKIQPTQPNKSASQLTQKAQLQKQKAQALKNLKVIEKEQKKIKVTTQKQKSTKKLPEILKTQSNKQNLHGSSIRKDPVDSKYSRSQDPNQSSKISLSQKPNIAADNFSIVDGRKVYMSEQDVTKLKILKLENRRREQQIKNKVVAHQLLLEKIKTQEILTKQQRVEQDRQKRKKSIEERQTVLSKQREKKMQRYQEENKKLKQIKKSLKLFQKMEKQYQKVQECQKNGVNQMIKSRVGQGVVNFDQIKQHQLQYLQRNRQNIENSRVKIKLRIKQLEDKFSHLNLHKSQFYDRVKNEKKEIMLQMQENERKKKVYSQKIREYKEIVKENYLPKVKPVQKIQQKKKHAPNFSQVHDMGNQYMKQSGKLIDRNKSLNLLEKLQKQQAQRSTKKVYKNYLQQNRMQSSPQRQGKSQQKHIQVQKQMKSINSMKNPRQKYEKINILHKKIQKQLRSQNPGRGSQKLKLTGNAKNKQSEKDVQQIRAKLKILEGLQNHQGNK